MQRKTDRFQRIVAQAGKRIDGISPALADPMFTVKLLRRQHRALVKMIEEATRYDEFEERYPEPRHGIAMMEKGRYINRESVLDDINEYKR